MTTYGELSDVLIAIATLVGSATDFTVTINGVTYSYDTDAFKDEEGNELSGVTLTAGAYTLVFSLADTYDAWADGVTGDIEIEITIFEQMATKASTYFETEITATYGTSSDVLGYIADLVGTDETLTVTIDGTTYSYTDGALMDESGNALSAATLEAGRNGIDYRICFQRMNFIAAIASR